MGDDTQELVRLRKIRRSLWLRYLEMKQRELELVTRLRESRQQTGPEVEAPLAARYERTFTGTFVGRKLDEEHTHDEVDPGAPGEIQGDDEGESEGKDERPRKQ